VGAGSDHRIQIVIARIGFVGEGLRLSGPRGENGEKPRSGGRRRGTFQKGAAAGIDPEYALQDIAEIGHVRGARRIGQRIGTHVQGFGRACIMVLQHHFFLL